MKQNWIRNFATRKCALTAMCMPFVMTACGGDSDTAQAPGTVLAPVMASSEAQARPAQGGRRYSVVNLGLDGASTALLNERGQAAFGAFTAEGVKHGFFDGDHLHPIGSLGGQQTWVVGMNNEGVVVGESEDGTEPRSEVRAFRWTLDGGMRALPGSSVSRATDVNDKGDIVGLTPAPGISARAVRWGLDGSVTGLGPLPLSLSEALGVNNDGMSAGFADVADGSIHATVWDRAGNVTDLGTLGGIVNIALHINERGQAAGIADRPGSDDQMGFFWSARDGMVPIDVRGGGSRLVAALNDQGDLVGDTTSGGRELAYFWSRRRGVVLLPIGTGIRSDVFDVNNQAEMVGTIERPASEGGGMRAVRWPGIASPIDLNTQLYRAPAGLVLSHGAAINDKGVILAFSNAGLVLLRPGKQGTDAPVLGPMMGLPAAVELGQQVAFTVGFTDNASGETHTASASWGDQCPATAPAVSESGGTGEVSLQHRFCAPGIFVVRIQVTDSGGRSTEILREIEVTDPALAAAGGKAAPVRVAAAAEAARTTRLLRPVRP